MPCHRRGSTSTPQTSSMTDVFVHKDGKESGPYTLAELKARLQTGAFRSTDLAWYEGIPEWKPIAELLPQLGETSGSSSPPPAKRSPVLLFAAFAVLLLMGAYAFVTETGPRKASVRTQEVAEDDTSDDMAEQPKEAVEEEKPASTHKSPQTPVVATKAPQLPLHPGDEAWRSQPLDQAPPASGAETVQTKPTPVQEAAMPAQEPVPEPPAKPEGPSDEIVQLGIKQYNSDWASSEFRRGEPLMSRNGTNLMPAGTVVYPVKISESGVDLTFYLFQDSFGDWMCAFNDLRSALPCK